MWLPCTNQHPCAAGCAPARMAAVDTVWDTLAAKHNSTVGESSEELAQTPNCSPVQYVPITAYVAIINFQFLL